MFFLLFLIVGWFLLVIFSFIFGDSSSGGNYVTDTHSSNSHSNSYSCNSYGEKNNSWGWQPYVDSDDKEYDSFGSYGTEDDLANWDENVDC